MYMRLPLSLPLILCLCSSLPMCTTASAQPAKPGPIQRREQSLSSTKQPPSYPRLKSGLTNDETKLALDIARAAFKSNEVHLYDAAYKLDARRLGIVLAPKDWHATSPLVKDGKYIWPTKSADSDNLYYDPAFFAFKTNGGVHPSLYLQKAPQNGARYAVRQFIDGPEIHYELSVVKSADSLGSIFEQLDSGKGSADIQVISNHSWLSPWFCQSPLDNQIMALTTGNQARSLDDWQIYKIDKSGKAINIGTIGFMPEFARDFDLLPDGPIKQMALLLDQMIGPATVDNGGFNPPARLKTRIRHMWANLLYRPYAMEQPPDAKAAIDRAIGKWSQESAHNFAQARKLNALYPAALKQLTQYYSSQQKLSAEEAKALASKNLDLAFRTHFDL